MQGEPYTYEFVYKESIYCASRICIMQDEACIKKFVHTRQSFVHYS